MRLSVSDRAVSIRMGMSRSSRSETVSATPSSPGIITSRISMSKSRPRSLRRASPALQATVTRKPLELRNCLSNSRIRVSSSTTSRCGASSDGATYSSVIQSISPGEAPSTGKAVDLRAAVGIHHCLEKLLDDLSLRFARLLQCLADAAGLWRSERKQEFSASCRRVELPLTPVCRPRQLHDISGIDQLLQDTCETLLGDSEHIQQFCDGQSREPVDEMQHPMVCTAKAVSAQEPVRIGSEISISEEK